MLDDIDRANVSRLQVAWMARAGDFPAAVFDPLGHRFQGTREDGSRITPAVGAGCGACHQAQIRFETTPLMLDDHLYLSTPLNRVLALDPSSGEERWSFDPGVDLDVRYGEDLVSRGVSHWQDPLAPEENRCSRRIFLATIDARLIALDARNGIPCEEFAEGGVIRLDRGVGLGDHSPPPGSYGSTSPPLVVGDLIVVGSTVSSQSRTDAESGVVRAYDARNGSLRWAVDPIPRSPLDPGWEAWRPEEALRTGGGNAWSLMSGDEDLDLVLVPTASPSPDHFGGARRGSNDMANSVVAIRASTGEVLWWQQIVHHDLWDYDVAAQPLLFSHGAAGERRRAVLVGSKTGMLFLFDARSGQPIFRVEETPVPASDVPGEEAWGTQPFSPDLPNLHGTQLTADSAFGTSSSDRAVCRDLLSGLRNEGLFTPPSLEGTLLWPGPWGGINWDGMALDPERQVVVTVIRRLGMMVRLVRRDEVDEIRGTGGPGVHFGAQWGTDYIAMRQPVLAPSGTPCTPPPWGLIGAINLADGKTEWMRPLGTVPWLSEIDGSETWGSLVVGGPLVTAGGLVFIGGTQDDRFRALDIESGRTLWEAQLPAGAQAAPMTYRYGGVQYVVVAAGGRGGIGSPGDWIVAFALR